MPQANTSDLLDKNNQNQTRFAQLADELTAKTWQVTAAVDMLDEGATVPFISRYRKEATGGLTDSQLRLLQDRVIYLRDLDSRRESILQSIEEQGKLNQELSDQINSASTKSELEDLYLPFKKKRETKGQKAIKAGLQPLADSLWANPDLEPDVVAQEYFNTDAGIDDSKSALEGARFILMEKFAEDAELIQRCRTLLTDAGFLCSRVFDGKESEGEKFRDYFDFQEKLSKVPSHRALAMFRGRAEGVLALSLQLNQADGEFGNKRCIATVAQHTGFENNNKNADAWRAQVINWTWKVKLAPHLESELLGSLRDTADKEAIRVFANNLKDLLLAAPAGQLCTLGLDPGYRSGVKVAVVDHTGKLLEHTTIYPHVPQKQWNQALAVLCKLCKTHDVKLIAIGNGTASRETEQLAADVVTQAGVAGLQKIVVSEAGASVYSASEIAEKEFPELDVTIRGAVSIARRLQDPLAELVKIDPKAIGVGQYQHDVSQFALARSLDATVEDCVNSVGVDLNTASSALLTRVSGLSETLAGNIVAFRDEQGIFDDRNGLKKVPRLGPKAFEQCAGFLRIRGGSNPLDASGVHPEAYPVIKKIEASTGKPVNEILGESSVLRELDANEFTDERFGLPTVKDILIELDKPGRDPRPEFRTVKFDDDVSSISDLKPNAVMEGQITNVTNFGAFVDIGVHQDGLVHISALSDSFVKDPQQVVKTGDIVKVKVMSVDAKRNRIGLTMRLTDEADNEGKPVRQTRTSGKADAQSDRQRSKQSGQRNYGDKQAGKPSGNKSGRSRHHNKSSGKHHQDSSPPSALATQLKAALEKNQG